MRLFPIVCLLTFATFAAFGQDNAKPDTILCNNGKVVIAHIIDTSSDKITIEKPNSSKHKKIEIDRNAVFSIKYGNGGKEVLVYIYDTLIGNDFSVADARMFIAGEQDAQRGYHPRIASLGAFLAGTASGISGISLFAFGPPFLYSGIMAYPRIKISHRSVKNLNNVKSDPYLYGYDSVGRRKRVLRSFIWSGIGLVVGFTLHFTVFKNGQF
jgi:hypothetical protein